MVSARGYAVCRYAAVVAAVRRRHAGRTRHPCRLEFSITAGDARKLSKTATKRRDTPHERNATILASVPAGAGSGPPHPKA